MSLTNQPPNTFPSKRRTSAPQAGSQIRPENNLPDSLPTDGTKDPMAAIKKAFRDYGDLFYQLRNGWTPTGLYAQGNTTGDPIVVPVAADASDLGTGIGLQVQLTRPGTWILSSSVSLKAIGDTGQTFTLTLTVNNSPQALTGIVVPAGDGTTPVVQFWQVTSITGDENCTLKISKIAGGGTSAVIPANSSMTANWQGGSQ